MPLKNRFMYRNLLSVACFALQLILCGSELLDAQSSAPVDKSSLPDNPQPQTRTSPNGQTISAPRITEDVDAPWPRKLDRGDVKIAMYQPQVEAWEGESLRAYAALSVTQNDNKPKYGVVSFQARTEVDKVNRQVTLDEFQITAVKFPTMPEQSLLI